MSMNEYGLNIRNIKIEDRGERILSPNPITRGRETSYLYHVRELLVVNAIKPITDTID